MAGQFSWGSRFAKLSSILPEDSSTWKGKIFLTVDIDWAADPILGTTIDLLEKAGVSATFFVTHRTDHLGRLRQNKQFELGVHPNFNGLLDGTMREVSSAAKILDSLLHIIPEAKAVRSHSMTQSSRLLELFRGVGLTHDCNHFIPAHSGIVLCPYRHWNDMIRVPYCWEDDVDLIYRRGPTILEVAVGEGLKVFDFHPIHVALNTSSMEDYERSREAHQDWESLQQHVFAGDGVRSRLVDLLQGPGEMSR